MEEIIWSKLALADLDRIHDFIALDSPFLPERLLNRYSKESKF